MSGEWWGRFIPLSEFCRQSYAFLFTGFGQGRCKKVLVGSLATCWFPVALSALPLPVPHIAMRSGTSAFRPQGCLWWEVAQATCRYSLQMLESCLYQGSPHPTWRGSWGVIVPAFPCFGGTVLRLILQFLKVPRGSESQSPATVTIY